ncbi:DUF5789 family protein [Halopenitus salinus]|jgi:hypothetical protein|uniref:DUF5789 family protein n=1 Tax=Halopenitus salinus TaxID=1198295 RepID=A0ABD5URK2_9EURY
MSEDAEEETEETEPAVELGEERTIEGQPVARVASRLVWPKSNGDVAAQEGSSTIRTPEGPRELSAVLEETDETFFETRRAFIEAVEDVVGRGPVATE